MLKKITGKAITWTALDEIPPETLSRIESLVKGQTIEPGVAFIKNNTVRSAFLLKPEAGDGSSLFIKWFKKPRLIQRIRYLVVPSKALAEWRNLRILEKSGLPCPKALAFFEKRSWGMLETACLVIQGLENAQPLNEFSADCSLTAAQKFTLTRQLARLSAAMHATGIFSRDYHAGNIMIRPAGQGFELFLIDLHRARVVKKISPSMIIADLAKLSKSLPASRSARLRFAREYYRHAAPVAMPLSEFMQRIHEKTARITTRQILSRSRRCILKSSVFEISRSWRERYCGRRDFGHAAARTLIAQHLDKQKDQQTIIKKSSKSTLTTHALQPGQTQCVKGCRNRGFVYALLNLFKKSRALKSWIAANGLIVRGVLTPLPLAMVEKRCGPLVQENFYICNWLENSPELNTYITGRQWQDADKKKFVRCLAKTIAGLHARGIYHADLKSNNILVRAAAASWEFFFVDLDRVSFNRPLTFDRRANNLAQIHASVADVMTVRDRLYFFRIYSREAACYTDRKKYFERIRAISRTKNTQPYGLHISQ